MSRNRLFLILIIMTLALSSSIYILNTTAPAVSAQATNIPSTNNNNNTISSNPENGTKINQTTSLSAANNNTSFNNSAQATLVNGTLSLGQFGDAPITYASINGTNTFQEDIVLSNNIVNGRAAVDEFTINKPWPNAVIPYVIDSDIPNKQSITDAIHQWESQTIIKFVPLTSSNKDEYPNFVMFKKSPQFELCSSEIGMASHGGQDVNVGGSCTVGNIMHEIGHTVGLWHEQVRCDRDDYVDIKWRNINPLDRAQFAAKFCTSGSDSDTPPPISIGKYDYCSIMEYPENAFSWNNQPTIIPKQSVVGCEMGQRQFLSQGDIAAVNFIYRILER